MGFDLKAAKHLLRDIATFHALPVALKIIKPDAFEKLTNEYVVHRKGFSEMPIELLMPPALLEILEELEEIKPYRSIVRKLLLDTESFWKAPCSLPFATIVHTDLSVNNTMQNIENGEIVKNKIIDFQMYTYGNPLLDVVYFVFSSVQKEIVIQHLNDLIILYQECFFAVLDNLKCDTSSFQRDFLKQADLDGPKELAHLLATAIPIFRPKANAAVSLDATSLEAVTGSNVTVEARNHIRYILREFIKKGWIKE